jgi:hypothetical protein
MPCDGSVANIEGGERLRSTIEHVMATLPRGAHSGRVNEVDIMNGNNAFFMFATVSDGSVVSASLRGRVVRIKGRWKVSRETHCQAIGFSGISCPPR